ncbi:AbrB family transcriptional regulator [Niveispirillum sp. KHB5.9]|uniref:AbrB family transcriptional regulator n=1 Tax=Niveispirillum sp. KHB5.9 TaxID=3400269 RepID=UPI003A83732C
MLAKGAQWLGLALLTGLLVAGLKAGDVPAALLLGPLLAGIGFGLGGVAIRPAKSAMLASYTMVGCLAAVAMGRTMGPALLVHLPAFLLMAASTLMVSAGLGWMLGKGGWFRGSTAVWGLAPGGAAGMVAMAQEQGADARMVAIMQYLRILMVTGSAIALAHFLTDGATPLHGSGWFPPLDAWGLGETAALALVGALVAHFLRFPSGALLVPGLVGAALVAAGLAKPSVPPLLAAGAYAIIGWNIGLSFTRSTLIDCAQSMPRIITAAIGLIGLCALLGLLVSLLCGVDWLTGYLATTPGGIDAILIIGATVPVDLPFILSAQVVRVLVVLLVGPAFASFVARRLD